MAGNTINMYGGSYVDVHDNEVVNLNIDKATVSVNDDTRPCLSGTPSNLEGELGCSSPKLGEVAEGRRSV
jgi:hypothetical protein